MSKLVVTSEVCNVFNDRIAKLGVNGSVDVQDFVGNKFTKKALAVCNALLEELAKHDNHIKLIPNYKNACEV